MPILVPEFTKNSKGGTEQMTARLENHLKQNRPDLLEFFNIHVSRLVDYDESKPSIYIVHDLADDPEVFHLANEGWKKFDLIVFVSNWQFQQYQAKFKLDGTNCIILNNGIEVDPRNDSKWNDIETIKLIYHTTPHRGLDILVSAFSDLWLNKWSKAGVKIELDVYSSFSIYGWEERDRPYKELFDFCKEHPAINYHGAKSNEEVRAALKEAHIFAFPSVWPETSCLALIEAMSEGCLCIHPNLGALPETSKGCNVMYPFKTDREVHRAYFTRLLDREVSRVINDSAAVANQAVLASSPANSFHEWDSIADQWVDILDQVKVALETAISKSTVA